MKWRFATSSDSAKLADWNHRLIRDEGHRNPMTLPELTRRMAGWLSAEYRAVIFSVEQAEVGYALYRVCSDEIFLRHFFIQQEFRRKAYGRRAIGMLRDEIWRQNVRLTVEVLAKNSGAAAFWRAMGYEDYSLKLEILPKSRLV